jgi:phosphoribosylformylglycinamidine synthase
LKRLLASANICDKRWVFEQYDSMVQTNTIEGPGGEAGVMRIKQGSKLNVVSCKSDKSDEASELTTHNIQLTAPQRGIAMALAGNGRWAWLDPKLGAMHAVAEAARKVACTGATPVAATNCLNFGNPEKPEIMAQLSAAIDGIAEACTALGTPITGGNVSLYNETKGEGIYPTPVIGVVGLLEDVSKAVPSGFQREGEMVLSIYPTDKTPLTIDERRARFIRLLGSTEFARVHFDGSWGLILEPDLEGQAALNSLLAEFAASQLISSANDVGSGGLAVCLARCAMAHGVGAEIDPMIAPPDAGPDDALSMFVEAVEEVVVTCPPENEERVVSLAEQRGLACIRIGRTGSSELRVVRMDGMPFITLEIDAARAVYSSTLEGQLAAEVVTA